MNIQLTIGFLFIGCMCSLLQSCGASRAIYTQKDIETVQNPYLFFHTDGIAGEGGQLGEIPACIRFNHIEVDHSLDSLILTGTVIDGETGEALPKSTIYVCETVQCDTLTAKRDNLFPNWCRYKIITALDADGRGKFVLRTKLSVTRNIFVAGYLLSYFGRVYHIGYLAK